MAETSVGPFFLPCAVINGLAAPYPKRPFIARDKPPRSLSVPRTVLSCPFYVVPPLCGGPLVQSKIKSLQPSVDRIDSSDISYSDANMHITHLACNLAKNEWGLSDFTDWLAIVQAGDIEIHG